MRRHNLKQLQVMKDEAEHARDKARVGFGKKVGKRFTWRHDWPHLQRMLQHQEEECYENKKKRDKELTEYRKEAEEKKEFADRVDRRVGSAQCVHRFSF